MVRAEFDGNVLPLKFEYQLVPSKRVSVVKTFTSIDVQQSDYVVEDEAFTFKIPFADLNLRNLFYNAFKDTSIHTFKDYDGNTYSVIIFEYNEEEVSGAYNITGRMQKV